MSQSGDSNSSSHLSLDDIINKVQLVVANSSKLPNKSIAFSKLNDFPLPNFSLSIPVNNPSSLEYTSGKYDSAYSQFLNLSNTRLAKLSLHTGSPTRYVPDDNLNAANLDFSIVHETKSDSRLNNLGGEMFVSALSDILHRKDTIQHNHVDIQSLGAPLASSSYSISSSFPRTDLIHQPPSPVVSNLKHNSIYKSQPNSPEKMSSNAHLYNKNTSNMSMNANVLDTKNHHQTDEHPNSVSAFPISSFSQGGNVIQQSSNSSSLVINNNVNRSLLKFKDGNEKDDELQKANKTTTSQEVNGVEIKHKNRLSDDRVSVLEEALKQASDELRQVKIDRDQMAKRLVKTRQDIGKLMEEARLFHIETSDLKNCLDEKDKQIQSLKMQLSKFTNTAVTKYVPKHNDNGIYKERCCDCRKATLPDDDDEDNIHTYVNASKQLLTNKHSSKMYKNSSSNLLSDDEEQLPVWMKKNDGDKFDYDKYADEGIDVSRMRRRFHLHDRRGRKVAPLIDKRRKKKSLQRDDDDDDDDDSCSPIRSRMYNQLINHDREKQRMQKSISEFHSMSPTSLSSLLSANIRDHHSGHAAARTRSRTVSSSRSQTRNHDRFNEKNKVKSSSRLYNGNDNRRHNQEEISEGENGDQNTNVSNVFHVVPGSYNKIVAVENTSGNGNAQLRLTPSQANSHLRRLQERNLKFKPKSITGNTTNQLNPYENDVEKTYNCNPIYSNGIAGTIVNGKPSQISSKPLSKGGLKTNLNSSNPSTHFISEDFNEPIGSAMFKTSNDITSNPNLSSHSKHLLLTSFLLKNGDLLQEYNKKDKKNLHSASTYGQSDNKNSSVHKQRGLNKGISMKDLLAQEETEFNNNLDSDKRKKRKEREMMIVMRRQDSESENEDYTYSSRRFAF